VALIRERAWGGLNRGAAAGLDKATPELIGRIMEDPELAAHPRK